MIRLEQNEKIKALQSKFHQLQKEKRGIQNSLNQNALNQS